MIEKNLVLIFIAFGIIGSLTIGTAGHNVIV
jgi:hypothetical protein